MRSTGWVAAWSIAGAIAAGCASGGGGGGDGGGPRVDSGTIDAGAIDAGAVDAGAIDSGGADAGDVDASAVDGGSDGGRPPLPTIVVQTSGGGVASGSGHVVRLSIGAPQPMGRASGAGGTVVLGPQAGAR